MKMYIRVYFSLCLYLAISGRPRTQRKLNPHEKFPIYGNRRCVPQILFLTSMLFSGCDQCIGAVLWKPVLLDALTRLNTSRQRHDLSSRCRHISCGHQRSKILTRTMSGNGRSHNYCYIPFYDRGLKDSLGGF